ncbi:hypothetical protein C8J56DRAFT_883799 [Mycena floridula]|nr:hypothetical protein C8J56DRAFT_883799 [Mycena floridula]
MTSEGRDITKYFQGGLYPSQLMHEIPALQTHESQKIEEPWGLYVVRQRSELLNDSFLLSGKGAGRRIGRRIGTEARCTGTPVFKRRSLRQSGQKDELMLPSDWVLSSSMSTNKVESIMEMEFDLASLHIELALFGLVDGCRTSLDDRRDNKSRTHNRLRPHCPFERRARRVSESASASVIWKSESEVSKRSWRRGEEVIREPKAYSYDLIQRLLVTPEKED